MAVKTAFVVDDSRVARVILGRLLSSRGLDVTELESGEEALSRLREGANPDVIFMDMVMQGLSGVETTEQIKAEIKTQHIPVIMCTGNDGMPERMAAISAGASSIVAKPPVEGELEKALAPFQNMEQTAIVEDVSPVSLVTPTSAAPKDWDTPLPPAQPASLAQTQSEKNEKPVFDDAAFMKKVQSEMTARFEKAEALWMAEVLGKVKAQQAVEKIDFDEQFAAAAESLMPQVSKNVEAMIAEEKESSEQRLSEATATWMPEVAENMRRQITEFEKKELPEIVSEMVQQTALGQEDVEKVSKAAAEETVSNIAKEKVEQAVTEFNLVAQIQTAISAQTAAWLAMQKTQLEQTMLPIMQEKLAEESASHIEAGLTEEVLLHVKAGVQEDVYATIEHLTENVVNPLKKQIKILTIGLVVLGLIVMMIIF